MLPRDEAIEFLESSFKQWVLIHNDDPEVLRKFTTATYTYLMDASHSPQGLLRRILEKQKEAEVVHLYTGEGE